MSERKTAPNPWLFLAAGITLSLPGAAALTAVSRIRMGRVARGRAYYLLSIISFPLIIAPVLLIPAKWHVFAWSLAAINILTGLVFHFLNTPDYRIFQDGMRRDGKSSFRGGAGRIIFGIASASCPAVASGYFFGIFYIWLADRVLSVVFPVNPSGFSPANFAYAMTSMFLLAGFVIGGVSARHIEREDLAHAARLAISVVIAASILMFMEQLFIESVNFQSYGIDYSSDFRDKTTLLFGPLFFVFTIAGAFFIYSSSGAREFAGRTLLAVYLSFALSITTILYTGVASYDILILGKIAEKQGNTRLALKAYEKSLTLYPSRYSASYLQFRIGLLLHSLGHDREALLSFKNVLTRYTENKVFVKQSKTFIDLLADSNPKSKRVVIEGIDTQTEYRSAYCAPNSLALVFNHWGKRLSAKQIGTSITYTFFGTSMSDMAMFAEDNSFEYVLMDNMKLDDIRRFVDKGIPVLVFIPQHVFVIFGYDTAIDTFISYDVAEYDVWVEHPAADFEKEWRMEGNTLALMYPKNRLLPSDTGITRRENEMGAAYFNYLAATEFARTEAYEKKMLVHASKTSKDLPFPPLVLFDSFQSEREDFAKKYDVREIIKQSNDRIMSRAEISEATWGNMPEYTGLMAYYGKLDEAWGMYSAIEDKVGKANYDFYSSKAFLSYMTGNYSATISDINNAIFQSESGDHDGDGDGEDQDYSRYRVPDKEEYPAFAYFLGIAYEKTNAEKLAYHAYLNVLSSNSDSPDPVSRLAFDKLMSFKGEPYVMKKGEHDAINSYIHGNGAYDSKAHVEAAEYLLSKEKRTKDDVSKAKLYLRRALVLSLTLEDQQRVYEALVAHGKKL